MGTMNNVMLCGVADIKHFETPIVLHSICQGRYSKDLTLIRALFADHTSKNVKDMYL